MLLNPHFNTKEDKYKNSISSKLFMDCMKMSDGNFKYLNKRINDLEDSKKENDIQIKRLNQIVNKFFLVYKEHHEDINTIKINLDSLFKKLLIIYTKYDNDISSSFKKINSNTKLLLEEILYNSQINDLLIHNKIDDAKKSNGRKRNLEETIELLDETIDNSPLFPRKSARIADKEKEEKEENNKK